MANGSKIKMEDIGNFYYNEDMSISYIEYKHGIARDKVIELLDAYDKEYNKEKYKNTAQVNDLVRGVYLYKGRIYEVEGTVAIKYTRSVILHITGGDELPHELLNVVLIPKKSVFKILEKGTVPST